MQTPLALLADRVEFGPVALRRAALGSVVVTMLIIVGGAIVRVTGSGLGCPTWPSCVDGALGPTPEMGLHGVIEFGNRLLTGVLCVAVGIVIVVARCQRPLRADVLRTSWAQFWIVVLNAVVGGITVLARLSPYIVAAHFIAAMLLLTVAVRTFDLASTRVVSGAVFAPKFRSHSVGLVGAAAVVILLGTVVTGTGVHAGDSAAVHRMPLDWTTMTIAHGSAAVVLIAVAISLMLRSRAGDARALTRLATTFVCLLAAQGTVGVAQALGMSPEAMIVLHLLGAALIWAGALRILFEVARMRSEEGSPDAAQPVARQAKI